MMHSDIADTLNYYHDLYNNSDFIESDPVFIPHQFSEKHDIEISGLFAATLAWGQRTTIIKNSMRLMQLMDHAPYDFIMHHSDSDLMRFGNFVHRTFNSDDVLNFVKGLKHIYGNEKNIGSVFENYLNKNPDDVAGAISHFRNKMLQGFKSERTKKHVADPLANSSAKRLCMYMRWMVRKDKRKVDFGLWNIPASVLHCPLDLHSARSARELGLLTRTQNDWKAVVELTENLKLYDATDPVKYDFALFGMSINK